MTTIQDLDDDELVVAAQGGDRAAFDVLIVRRRRELHAHCYRMLASADDADDAVQEATVRAWTGLRGFEHKSSFRTWLFKITTNAALDVGRRRSRRELPVALGAATTDAPGDAVDLPWISPFPSDPDVASPEATLAARETLELAYVAALQHLTARQRAVFILREVLGFSAAETATILETTTTTVTSLLQRARASIGRRLPTVSQQAELASMGDAVVRELAERYASAIERADLEALLGLLTEDVTWSMPPLPSWYGGKQDVASFLTRFVFPERWTHLTTTANGQLAVAGYLFDDDRGCYLPAALDVLDLRDGRVASVIGFLTGEALRERLQQRGLFGRFGLPATVSV